ncbi:dihydrolipoyl dehydrogenase [Patulibacter sp. NPDC049589]|uniref:dihydrolipoyl dehydrogenase n=1 Tax=Patulibacter sp. NPDC049589 TaxID=3154731 RepID=UPI003430D692
MSTIEVKVPDIGDFDDVPVTEILVAVGDEVAKEDPLVALESEKATMEVPSPEAGTVKELKVAEGDTVSEGSVILVLETADAGGGAGDAGGSSDGAEAQGGAKDASNAKGEDGSSKDDAGSEPPKGGDGTAGGASGDDAAKDAKTGEPATAGASESGGSAATKDDAKSSGAAPSKASDEVKAKGDLHVDVVVLGSGPGGYSAAFRAADLGLSVALVEREPVLGGVCLNVGCIPSKALLHAAKVITEAEDMGAHGVSFQKPEIDLDALRSWKDEVVGKLSGGVEGMAKQRKVEVVKGTGKFVGEHELRVDETLVTFDSAIVATGSRSVQLPGIPHEEEIVIDSTGALELADVPKRLLVVGGGIIGLEMATVYDALGSDVTVVELADQLVPGADKDLVKPLKKRIDGRYAAIHLKTKVEKVEVDGEVATATFAGDGDVPEPAEFDRVLVAVGRVPNGQDLGLEDLGVEVDERGFVPVDQQQRTKLPHILAIGDVVGQPMLAHKATHEAHVAAEVIAGHDVVFDPRGIPSVAYTEPELAWVGLTETQAKQDDVPYETAVFPWVASGRALASDASAGQTKLLVDPESRRILGAAIVGTNAGELIAEVGLALEMGANAEDVALTIHAHPTLSESVGLSAEIAEGTITDLPQKRKRTPKKG